MKNTKILALLLAAATAMTAAGCGESENRDISNAGTGSETASDDGKTGEKPDDGVYIDDEQQLYVNYLPYEEELNTMTELARRQYNAILERDAAGYLDTLNIQKLYEGIDLNAYLDQLENCNESLESADENAKDEFEKDYEIKQAYHGTLSMNSGILGDCVMLRHGDLMEEINSTEDRHEAQLRFDKALSDAIPEINADLMSAGEAALEDGSVKKLDTSYFTERDSFPDDAPLSENTVFAKHLIMSCEKDGGKYIVFGLTCTDGDRVIEIGRVTGWVKDGKYGVLTDLIGQTPEEYQESLNSSESQDAKAE